MAGEAQILDPMQARVDAAMRLARTVAGDDDARFLRTFHAIVNAVDDVDARIAAQASVPSVRAAARSARAVAPAGDIRALGATAGGIPRDSVFSDAAYLANAQWLLRNRRRIVGGVPIQAFPDCVAVGSRTAWCCSGTLVASDVVVTAAHCMSPGCRERVFVGTDVDRPDEGRVIRVRDQAVHPTYRPPRKKQGDLAVLLLAEPVDDVTPRRLARQAAVGKSRSVRVVGYGHTDAFGSTGYGLRRMVDVPLATNDPRFGGDPETEFVAGAPFLDRDSCSGDSGGPAYVASRGRWLLAGATSRATESSIRACGDGGIYTLVPAYRDWLAPFLRPKPATARRRPPRHR
jgi:secreted trypsin-like serine protease